MSMVATRKQVFKPGVDSQTAADATVACELAILRRMFNLAIEDGLLEVRPYIPIPALNNVRTGFVEEAELEESMSERRRK